MGGDPRRPLTNALVPYQPGGLVTIQPGARPQPNPLEALIKMILSARLKPRGQNLEEP